MRLATYFQITHLSKATQWFVAGLLLCVLIITRLEYLPIIQDATWAVFFLLGVYVRQKRVLAIGIVCVLVLDFVQIAARGGHQDYYLAPSFLYIIPAYSALWFAGRYFTKRYSENLKGLCLYFLFACIGIIACQLISSSGYYWMSLAVIDLTPKEFIIRTFEFLPLALTINLIYLSFAAMIHVCILQINRLVRANKA